MLLYLILLLFLYQLQEKLIFYPTHLTDDFQFQYFNNIEEIYLKREKPARIHAIHFKVNQPQGIILYFHGNARSLDDWGFAAQDFTQHNWEVLMPDYRTYGKSKGKLSEQALFDDARAWYDYIKNRYPESQIIIYGRSLGTGIATQLASQVNPQLLVLETPYLSMSAMVRQAMPIAPLFILNYKFESDNYIKDIECPIEILHGTLDDLIPYQQAQKLAQLRPNLTRFTTIEGGRHNDLSDFKAWKNRIAEILK